MRQFKIEISAKTEKINYRKNVTTNENCILKKISLKVQNPIFDIAFLNK